MKGYKAACHSPRVPWCMALLVVCAPSFHRQDDSRVLFKILQYRFLSKTVTMSEKTCSNNTTTHRILGAGPPAFLSGVVPIVCGGVCIVPARRKQYSQSSRRNSHGHTAVGSVPVLPCCKRCLFCRGHIIGVRKSAWLHIYGE